MQGSGEEVSASRWILFSVAGRPIVYSSITLGRAWFLITRVELRNVFCLHSRSVGVEYILILSSSRSHSISEFLFATHSPIDLPVPNLLAPITFVFSSINNG